MSKINDKDFKTKMAMFGVNFNFEINSSYMKIILQGFEGNGLDQEDFDKAFSTLMLTRKSNLYGRPSLADWIEAAGKSSWIDRLNSYRTMKGKDKEFYLGVIRQYDSELYNYIIAENKKIGVTKNVQISKK